MMHPGRDWWFDYGWVSMIIVWVLVLLVFIFVMKMVFGRSEKEEGGESPMDILERRYARGEISREEFERMKKNLM